MAAANVDTVAQLRFLATIKRQSAPPRCNPFAIVIQVLAVGMIFIGLTMTIIANWPGATTIGENPLKIAGPILLVVGTVTFIIGIIVVCLLNKRERRRWEKTIARIAASKPAVELSLATGKSEVLEQSAAVAGVGGGGGAVRDVVPPANMSAESDWSRDQSFEPNDDVPDAVRVKKARHRKPVATDTQQHSVDDETVAVRRKPPALPAAADYAGSTGSTEESNALLSADTPTTDTSKRLHVHVKALPGSTVHIQQGSTRPQVAPKPRVAAHKTSAETDI